MSMWPSGHDRTVRWLICHNSVKVVPVGRLPAQTGKACVLKTICMAETEDVAHGANTCEVVQEINT